MLPLNLYLILFLYLVLFLVLFLVLPLPLACGLLLFCFRFAILPGRPLFAALLFIPIVPIPGKVARKGATGGEIIFPYFFRGFQPHNSATAI